MLLNSLVVSSSEAISMVITVISFIFTYLSQNSVQTVVIKFVTLSSGGANYHSPIEINSIDVLVLQSGL